MADPIQPAGSFVTVPYYVSYAFAPDGKSLYESVGGTISRVDTGTGAVTATWNIGTTLGSISVTTDGAFLLSPERVAGQAGIYNGSYAEPVYVHLLDLSSGAQLTFQDNQPPNTPTFSAVATLPNSQALLVDGYFGASDPFVTLNTGSSTFTNSSGDYGTLSGFVSSTDHSHVLLTGTVYATDPSTGARTGYASMFLYTAGVGVTASYVAVGYSPSAIAVENSGLYTVSIGSNGAIPVQNSHLDIVADIHKLHPEINAVGAAFSPDDQTLYLLGSGAYELYALSTNDWTLKNVYALDGGGGTGLTASPDGHYLLSGRELIDLTKLVPVDFAGNNTLSTNGGALYGYGGDDTLSGSGASLYGGDGNDVLTGSSLLDGGNGNDSLSGSGSLYGDAGNDTLSGSSDAYSLTTLTGGTGDDTYYAHAHYSYGYGAPYYYGLDNVVEQPGEGRDTVYADGSGVVQPNIEVFISTSQSAVSIAANDQSDSIVGNIGNDTITAGLGADTITGGGGADLFIGTLAQLNGDTITDFGVGDAVGLTSGDLSSLTYRHVGTTLIIDGTAAVNIGVSGGHFIETARGLTPPNLVGVSSSYAYALTFERTPANLNDFDGDGHSDILWRYTPTGAISTWSERGNTSVTFAQDTYDASNIALSWSPAGTADVNGDGISDIVWHNNVSGQLAVWDATGRGDFQQSSFVSGTLDTAWSVAAMGDFDGDGKSDVLWRYGTGNVQLWRSTGTGFVQNAFSENVASSWHIQGVGDFNGDGKTDLLWRNDNGEVNVWNGSANGFTESAYDHAPVALTAHVAGVGDFNGDGLADILWRDDSGSIFVWHGKATGGFDDYNGLIAGASNAWHIIMVTDLNDDGLDDLLWRNDDGQISAWSSYGNNFTQDVYHDSSVGTSWQIMTQHFDTI